MIRLAQVLLLVSAGALWAGSRMVWVDVQLFDGLGQPKTTALHGASWSTALVPLAVLLLAAAVAALAVRGWPLRLLSLLVAAASALTAYLAISLWVIGDVAVRAAHLADVPITNLVGTQRHHGGAIVTLAAAVVTLAAAVLLLRSVARAKPDAARYERRIAASPQEAGASSERAIWDALDEGRDPTDPDNKGR
ncbi:TIGR02234 family membrane protein [Mycobacterium sp. NPDC048908]|uniref:TIGR02234 family membrane protein n=1 Tax=Mycobacterium sp. NPDC048908 TaxID=3364292 RepID=UPI00371BFC4F